MEWPRFPDEGSLAPLYNPQFWPGFYSSFFSPHHFTPQSLSQYQQSLLSSQSSLLPSSFAPSDSTSLGYSVSSQVLRPQPSLLAAAAPLVCSYFHAINSFTNIKVEPPSPSPTPSCTSDQDAMSSVPVLPATYGTDTAPGSASSADVGSGLSRARVSQAWARYQRICIMLEDERITPDLKGPELNDLIRLLMRVPVHPADQRDFVHRAREHGVSYNSIKDFGELGVSVTTLRGWERSMVKPAHARPRAPVWERQDVNIMKLAVAKLRCERDIKDSGFWRKVEEEMPKLGASHGFSAQAIAAKYYGRRRGDLARKAALKAGQ
ncbi:hypothetical protein FBEOM_5089 [Fusarium beomiforme]|uniref:Uncharacterized protein n=1 Tax=Fusarium beomiforme TaxID=44412 RepID=A0A9P5E0C4_9HYPO|nr:hypothetical protein FBEOM_5089 [Fusarium beomiforme]